eukprot:CAMPEP_0197659896 /NCGR_PEP_ID=MMETSP1338-20131121/49625_1 /TAXON_ID=43686 ORGANISM="Pelagodinium beii, Strain RCC1491" /NCGR_SAMPLE_ID=MMETSP1338 /ASSEMBLY_ACC=CAM_ASM_000754 /LENGTH=275 /DNA_ID=CAMNT_0043237069 /DNA_START=30 /DNA_END=857 /DNA_ORIENTATION=+
MASSSEMTPGQRDAYGQVPSEATSTSDITVEKRQTCKVFVVPLLVATLVLCAFLALYLCRPRPERFVPNELETLSEVTVPGWIMDLVHQAGDGNAVHRGNGLSDDPNRETLARIFEGTHVSGYPAGHAHGQFWILERLHSHSDKPTEEGLVELSKNAKLLRAGFLQAGFDFATFYHGSRNLFLGSILSGGFFYSRTDWLGPGIYFTSTFEHAQCYASDGGPILEVEVYWNPKNQSRYVKHKAHHSEANDVYLVTDPLVIIPISVTKCCPEEMDCM